MYRLLIPDHSVRRSSGFLLPGVCAVAMGAYSVHLTDTSDSEVDP
jgi:hypothetical protein